MPLPEKALIKSIRRRTGKLQLRARMTGIGDDCAVIPVPPGHEALITTDFSLEGIHFRREWHPPQSVGHRCLARGLSDIAAMGGEPLAAFLSLALPSHLPQSWVDRFIDGLLNLASQFGVSLAGGDSAESPQGVLADIVVLGSAPKRKAILRSGARPGDRIYVTGQLGGSAATLEQFFRGKTKPNPRDYPRHFYPVPRIEIGRFLRERRLATAMIDLSDGLSTDLSHICEESGVGAVVYEQSLPVATVGRPSKTVAVDYALHGGEDYELLFTSRPKAKVPPRILGVQVTEIGRITRGHKIFAEIDQRRTRLIPRGWEHFAEKH